MSGNPGVLSGTKLGGMCLRAAEGTENATAVKWTGIDRLVEIIPFRLFEFDRAFTKSQKKIS
ncbi:hypothetical protein NECAME_10397 [Necator americanus]|uniref:Uncharacterized protein n=1 Tax=Necator americanus TaxID=51031 RepID=W2T940_NECAM|nr:hypothetical protein NECAME_10397 [Necator americanus]ETN78368.1 hypothetical protein NECAME_10397 [Necator americanus]